MSESRQSTIFVYVFRYAVMPGTLVWTVLLAYACSVTATHELLNRFQNVHWYEHVLAALILLLAMGCFALFRYMVHQQRRHDKQQSLLNNDEDNESSVNDDIIEL